MTEEELMKTDVKHIKQWVRMAEQIICTNKREIKKSQGQRKFLDQYFKWNLPEKLNKIRHTKTTPKK
jgi:DNA helicase IV